MPEQVGNVDILPHLDPPVKDEEHTSIKALIQAELPRDHATTLHPSVKDRYSYAPKYSPIVQTAHDVIASNSGEAVPSKAIDTSRYEAPTAPDDPNDGDAWKQTLKRAYTSTQYLEGRAENLKALDEHGKNAWLVGNSQVEDELRKLEKELKDVKTTNNRVDEERRLRQEGVRGEMEGLDETWRASLGRAVEAEIAVEKLKMEALEKRRKLANGTSAPG